VMLSTSKIEVSCACRMANFYGMVGLCLVVISLPQCVYTVVG